MFNRLVLILCTISSSLAGFPFHTSEEECRTMKPWSTDSRPNLVSVYDRPFAIEVSDTIYGLTHHIRVRKTAEKPILGIFLQARLSDCSADVRPHGVFELLNGDSRLEYVDCDGTKRNGVVNKDYGRPYDRIDVNFSPDRDEHRRIHFIATVVTLGQEVWMDVSSESIRHVSYPDNRHVHCPKRAPRTTGSDKTGNGSDVKSVFVLLLVLMAVLVC